MDIFGMSLASARTEKNVSLELGIRIENASFPFRNLTETTCSRWRRSHDLNFVIFPKVKTWKRWCHKVDSPLEIPMTWTHGCTVDGRVHATLKIFSKMSTSIVVV
jgi:hypothetical protein